MVFTPNLRTLPAAQRALWRELESTPDSFTLYGGTALALYLGHRTSVDFDFSSNASFDPDHLANSLAYLKDAERIQVALNTLTCRVDRDGPVLVSFFGDLNLGQVAAREQLAEMKLRCLVARHRCHSVADTDGSHQAPRRMNAMKPLPQTAALLAVAKRVVWFKEPADALADPVHFLAHVMTYGTVEDLRVVESVVGEKEFLETLDRAPAGIFDPRSWAYWNLKCGRVPAPTLPVRQSL